MRPLRTLVWLVSTLSLAAAPSVLGTGGVALAAEPFAGEALVAWLPAPAVPVGEMRELHLLAIDAAGEPIDGLMLKVSASGGEAGLPKGVGDGLYVVPFTAPDAVGTYEVRFSGKAGKQSVSSSVSVTVEGLQGLTATADPGQLVLGQVSTATLKLAGAGTTGVLARTNSGTVGKPVRVGSTYTAQLTPPKVNFPQVALVTWVDAAQPVARYGWQAVPMSGSVAFPVKGPAGASVLLRVAGRDFGPETLDAGGAAKVQIEVPPGVNDATQVLVEGGTTKESPLPLGIPATKRLGLFPVAAAIPADPSVPVPVRVVVVTADGAPDEAAAPSFTVSRGSVGAATMVAPGIFEAVVTPPAEAGSITVTAALGDSEVHTDSLELDVLPGLPQQVAMQVTGEGDERTVTLEGRSGIQVSGASLTQGDDADGRKVYTVSELSDGVELLAVPEVALSPNPARHILVLPDATTLAPDASTGAWVISLDAFGLPVPGQQVSLAWDRLGGPVSVTTGDDGRARVSTRGLTAGLGSVRATSGTASGEAVVVVGAGLGPVSGLRGHGPFGARWAATHPVWTQGAVSAPPPVVASREFVQLEKLEGAEEGLFDVAIRVLDAKGQPVDGDPPAVALSAGEAGEVVRDAAGEWRVSVRFPADTATEVVLTTTTAAGTEERLTLREGAFQEPAPTPVAPAAEVDAPWLRARASGLLSTYRFQQVPGADSGGLLPTTLSVGGDGGAAASPAGFEVDARVWLDEANLPYLGFHGKVRSSFYAVDAAFFDAPAQDTLLATSFDVVGRYPFDTAGDRFWIGAKVGFAYDDFILFEGCLEPSCTLEYSSLGVPGLAFGPELGAEVGRLFLVAGYGFGLANFSQPYRHAVDVNVGVHIVDAFFVDAGFGSVSRRVDLLGADTGLQRGELNDSQMLGTLGVGLAL